MSLLKRFRKSKEMKISELKIEDYDEIYKLWKSSKGVGLSSSDSKESINSFLNENSGLSFIAKKGNSIVGAVLCGSDGRRGYIHHLIIEKRSRRDVGKNLVKKCLDGLKSKNIHKCHIFVFRDNRSGIEFWGKTGWELRNDLILMSSDIS